ncbi:MAG: MBL fold metallo-hydrolase [Candidatus Altiarchaeales archaeon]|nr:MBL fold metallo-hydrolase [Candidatus Altiarchaeales archaeon]
MSSNSYLVVGDRTCVIDPGMDPSKVLDRGREDNIGIHGLINTHCHYDHVAANPGILETGEITCYCHNIDAQAIEKGDGSLQLAGLFGEEPVRHRVDQHLEDGNTIDLGGVALEVLHTPGHTPGSICLYEPGERVLFTGDTIFVGGVGRTDFKGGSWDELRDSIGRLAEFDEKRGVERICPGHGPEGEGREIRRVLEVYF